VSDHQDDELERKPRNGETLAVLKAKVELMAKVILWILGLAVSALLGALAYFLKQQ
jgi:hypothetical protein